MKQTLIIIFLIINTNFCFSQIVSFESLFEVFQTESLDSAFTKLKRINEFIGEIKWNSTTKQYNIEGVINSQIFFARPNEGKTNLIIKTSGSNFYDSLLTKAKKELHFIGTYSQKSGHVMYFYLFSQTSFMKSGDPVVRFREDWRNGKRTYSPDQIEFLTFKAENSN